MQTVKALFHCGNLAIEIMSGIFVALLLPEQLLIAALIIKKTKLPSTFYTRMFIVDQPAMLHFFVEFCLYKYQAHMHSVHTLNVSLYRKMSFIGWEWGGKLLIHVI